MKITQHWFSSFHSLPGVSGGIFNFKSDAYMVVGLGSFLPNKKGGGRRSIIQNKKTTNINLLR